jgi:hypothetical protein
LTTAQVFTLIWFRPKLVFDFIAEYQYRQYFFVGFIPPAITALGYLINGQLNLGAGVLVATFLSFLIPAYAITFLAKSRYGSIATVSDTFYGYAYANVTAFLTLLGTSLSPLTVSDGNINANMLLITGLIYTISGIWGIILNVNAIASIHHISRGSAFLLNIIVGVFLTIFLGLVSLFLGYQVPTVFDSILRNT